MVSNTCNQITNLIIPLVVLIIIIYGVRKKVDVYNVFIDGSKESLGMIKDLFPTFILSLFTFAISWGTTHLFLNLWLQLILGGVVGSLFYLGMSFLMGMEQLNDIKYMLCRKS